jgi:hypothetical protein
MNKVIAVVLLLSFASLAFAGKDDKEELSPSETAKKWIDAAGKRDAKTLAKLASKTMRKQALKLLDDQGWTVYQGTVKIIHEETTAERAVVIYRLENPDAVFTAELRYGILDLVREGDQWKVTDQAGAVLKPGKPKP